MDLKCVPIKVMYTKNSGKVTVQGASVEESPAVMWNLICVCHSQNRRAFPCQGKIANEQGGSTETNRSEKIYQEMDKSYPTARQLKWNPGLRAQSHSNRLAAS